MWLGSQSGKKETMPRIAMWNIYFIIGQGIIYCTLCNVHNAQTTGKTMNNVNCKAFASFTSMKFYSGNILDPDLLNDDDDAWCVWCVDACACYCTSLTISLYLMLDNLK